MNSEIRYGRRPVAQACILWVLVAFSTDAFSQEADGPPRQLSLDRRLSGIRFPEGKLVAFTNATASVGQKGKVVFTLKYTRTGSTKYDVPAMAGALFVTKNSDWLKDQTGTMNENSPSAVLDDWSKSLSVGIPVSIISNSNGEPATGVVMCRVLKRSEGEVVFEATFPPQVLTDLTPNAVGIVVVEKKKKVFAPMGNVIWVGLSGEGIATPTVP